MGTVVGMLSIALTVIAWKTEQRRWVRWLSTSALFAVIFQGVLGGLRVVLMKLDLAIVHACVAQAFFCLAALVTVVTSRWWLDAPDFSQSEDASAGRRLIVACVFATVIIYLQLIVGATMRHNQAGLAVPDFPLAYGQLLPRTDSSSLAQINNHRAWDLNLPRVSAQQIWLHMGHRAGAFLVTLAIGVVAALVFIRHRGNRSLVVRTSILLVLLIAQITLGAATVLWRKPADVASAHVAVGALTLVTMFVLLVRCVRLYCAKTQATADTVRAAEPSLDVSEGMVVA
jgi:cytochrome c oxidase assembly protein subunit 15